MCYTANIDLLAKFPELPPLRKLVLLYLASRANEAGNCHPSYDRIALETGMSRRAVINSINDLVGAGIIEKRPSHDRTRGAKNPQSASNVYVLPSELVLHPWGIGSKSNAKPSGASRSLGGAQDAPGGVHEMHQGGALGAPKIHKGNIQKEITPCSPPQPAKPKSSPRGSRLPAGWSPPEEGIDFALKKIGRERAREELLRFRDYWSAQPGSKGVKLDWPATWRNWVRKASERFEAQRPQKREKQNWVRADGTVERA